MTKGGWLLTFLSILTGFLLAFHWFTLAAINVHWDEFHFLSQIYEAKRHALSAPLQTFHVRLLGWITELPGQEVEKVVYGRELMFLVRLLTLVAVSLWLAPMGATAALFAILAYLSISESLVHGASFRSDPLLPLLFMLSLVLAKGTSNASATLSGLLFSLALALNLKAGMLLLVFWFVVFFTEGHDRRYWGVHLVSLCASLLLLFSLHRINLLPPRGGAPANSISVIIGGFLLQGWSSAGSKTLMSSIVENPLFWILTLQSLYVFFRNRASLQVWHFHTLAFFPLMLLYRNAWPYFLPIALCCLLYPMAFAARQLLQIRFGEYLLAIFALLLFYNAAVHLQDLRAQNGSAVQKELLEKIHKNFPTPVPYIDRCGMVSSFPMVGPFLTGWQLERYRKRGQVVFKALLATNEVKFFLKNSPVFDSRRHPGQLLTEDLKALEDYFPYCDGLLCSSVSPGEQRNEIPKDIFRY